MQIISDIESGNESHFQLDLIHYCTSYLLSVFLLAKTPRLILEMSATYRLVSYLLADNEQICSLRSQCMIFNNNINLGSLQLRVCRYFFQPMYNKQLLDSVFVRS